MASAANHTSKTALVPEGRGAGTGGVLLRVNATVIDGPDLGLTAPLTAEPVVIGKSDGCDIVLTDSAVSKRHLELKVEGSTLRIQDLESTNGTFIGKNRIIESIVPVGSVVTLGRTRIHLRSEDDPLLLTPSSETQFGDLVGQSVAMRQVFGILERVSGRDVSVLLDGETGTGKELAARAIHEHSGRAQGPFVCLDCSAVAPELVESQLFGHRKGAFTGAMQDRQGVFESAEGGSIFLDELDSLPLDLQPKLLRLLETREVTRLGEFKPRPIDVRIVAACGRSPEDAVARRELRRDLYFRLAVVRVTLPSLRDRLDDLPLLVKTLLERIGKQPLTVEEGPGLSRLSQHPWMGNVRELRNVLERAILLAPTGVKGLDDLPLRLSPILNDGAETVSQGLGAAQLRLPYKEAKEEALARFERQYLSAALSRNGANLSKTARDVGLTRHHLRKLLRQHRLIAASAKGKT